MLPRRFLIFTNDKRQLGPVVPYKVARDARCFVDYRFARSETELVALDVKWDWLLMAPAARREHYQGLQEEQARRIFDHARDYQSNTLFSSHVESTLPRIVKTKQLYKLLKDSGCAEKMISHFLTSWSQGIYHGYKEAFLKAFGEPTSDEVVMGSADGGCRDVEALNPYTYAFETQAYFDPQKRGLEKPSSAGGHYSHLQLKQYFVVQVSESSAGSNPFGFNERPLEGIRFYRHTEIVTKDNDDLRCIEAFAIQKMYEDCQQGRGIFHAYQTIYERIVRLYKAAPNLLNAKELYILAARQYLIAQQLLTKHDGKHLLTQPGGREILDLLQAQYPGIKLSEKASRYIKYFDNFKLACADCEQYAEALWAVCRVVREQSEADAISTFAQFKKNSVKIILALANAHPAIKAQILARKPGKILKRHPFGLTEQDRISLKGDKRPQLMPCEDNEKVRQQHRLDIIRQREPKATGLEFMNDQTIIRWLFANEKHLGELNPFFVQAYPAYGQNPALSKETVDASLLPGEALKTPTPAQKLYLLTRVHYLRQFISLPAFWPEAVDFSTPAVWQDISNDLIVDILVMCAQVGGADSRYLALKAEALKHLGRFEELNINAQLKLLTYIDDFLKHPCELSILQQGDSELFVNFLLIRPVYTRQIKAINIQALLTSMSPEAFLKILHTQTLAPLAQSLVDALASRHGMQYNGWRLCQHHQLVQTLFMKFHDKFDYANSYPYVNSLVSSWTATHQPVLRDAQLSAMLPYLTERHCLELLCHCLKRGRLIDGMATLSFAEKALRCYKLTVEIIGGGNDELRFLEEDFAKPMLECFAQLLDRTDAFHQQTFVPMMLRQNIPLEHVAESGRLLMDIKSTHDTLHRTTCITLLNALKREAVAIDRLCTLPATTLEKIVAVAAYQEDLTPTLLCSLVYALGKKNRLHQVFAQRLLAQLVITELPRVTILRLTAASGAILFDKVKAFLNTISLEEYLDLIGQLPSKESIPYTKHFQVRFSMGLTSALQALDNSVLRIKLLRQAPAFLTWLSSVNFNALAIPCADAYAALEEIYLNLRQARDLTAKRIVFVSAVYEKLLLEHRLPKLPAVILKAFLEQDLVSSTTPAALMNQIVLQLVYDDYAKVKDSLLVKVDGASKLKLWCELVAHDEVLEEDVLMPDSLETLKIMLNALTIEFCERKPDYIPRLLAFAKALAPSKDILIYNKLIELGFVDEMIAEAQLPQKIEYDLYRQQIKAGQYDYPRMILKKGEQALPDAVLHYYKILLDLAEVDQAPEIVLPSVCPYACIYQLLVPYWGKPQFEKRLDCLLHQPKVVTHIIDYYMRFPVAKDTSDAAVAIVDTMTSHPQFFATLKDDASLQMQLLDQCFFVGDVETGLFMGYSLVRLGPQIYRKILELLSVYPQKQADFIKRNPDFFNVGDLHLDYDEALVSSLSALPVACLLGLYQHEIIGSQTSLKSNTSFWEKVAPAVRVASGIAKQELEPFDAVLASADAVIASTSRVARRLWHTGGSKTTLPLPPPGDSLLTPNFAYSD